MRVPYTITGEAITLFHKGKVFNIPSTYRKFAELKEHLRQKMHDIDFIESIVNVRSTVERLAQGNIKVFGDEVYFKSVRVRNALAERLVKLLDEGYDITAWLNFMENVMLNPSEDSRERLFAFLEKNNSPFTEDGHFLGFKRVRSDFKDHYTGKMDNSPGQIVQVDRNKVDPDNSRTCSHGLHISASIYLTASGYADSYGAKVLVCKVNPRDVVAVPPDYNETKMRVCRYEVLSEVELGSIHEVEQQEIYGVEPNQARNLAAEKADENDLKTAVVETFTETMSDYHFGSIKVDIDESTVFVELVDIFEDFEDEYNTFDFIRYFREKVDNLSNEIFSLDETIDEVVYSLTFDEEPYSKVFIDLETLIVNGEFDEIYKGRAENLDDVVDMIEFIREYAEGEDNDEDEKVAENDKYELTFTRNGDRFTQSEILNGVAKYGSITKWANTVGVPRSTAQDWVKKITNN